MYFDLLYVYLMFYLLPIIAVTESQKSRPVRLAGGEVAKSFEFPFMTVIFHKTKLCSGSIISAEWILTAAHCLSISRVLSIKYMDVKVIAGQVNHKLSERTEYTQIRQGIGVFVHPKFRNSNLTVANNDLALIRVKPFVLTAAVNIVNLSDKGFPLNGFMECVAIGWGEIDLLPKQQNTILHKLIVRASISAEACPGLRDWERAEIICLQQNNGKGLCVGDSGGPLICQGELYGIAHQVYKEIKSNYERKDLERCGGVGVTHTYMFVCPYLNWIHFHTSTVPKKPLSCYYN